MKTNKTISRLLLIFLITGFTTNSYTKHKKPWSRRKKAFVGILIGGAIGAGVGAGIGASATCCCSKAATGAGIGFAVGATTGAAVGASRKCNDCNYDYHNEKEHRKES